MPLDVKDGAEFAARDGVAQRGHRWPEAAIVSDREHCARLPAGVEHPRRIGAAERQRLFAEHLFSRGGAGHHLRGMQRMRRRQQHRVDRRIRQHGIEAAGQLQMMFGAKATRAVDIGFDGANDFEPRMTGRRPDELPAPAAEADNRRVDHRESFPFDPPELTSS